MYDYFYGSQSDQFAFYRIPKVLFTAPRFKTLSTDAKALYGILLVKVGMQISSVVRGGLILFVAGCLIYTITRQTWSQTFLLILIEAAVMGITIGTGIIESLVDAALMGIAGI